MVVKVSNLKKPISFPEYYEGKGYKRAFTKKQFLYFVGLFNNVVFFSYEDRKMYVKETVHWQIGEFDDGQGGISGDDARYHAYGAEILAE